MRRRRSWFRRLIQRIAAWVSRLWGRGKRDAVVQKNNVATPETTQVKQQFTGDKNIGIGSIGENAKVEIYQGMTAAKPGEPVCFGVPYQRNIYFTGRTEILKKLHRQLTQMKAVAISQVQAISGLGGIGKTQTAVEYAYRYFYDETFYSYVFWVKADTGTNLATDFANLAAQLVLPEAKGTEEEKIPAVRAWLTNQDGWLLVFDNADEPELLVDWLPNNPKGTVLLTSRAAVFDSVGIKQPIALDVLHEDEAVALLLQRTGRKEEASAAALNEKLDGLPLALEQAGAYIKQQHIGFESYLKLYDRLGLTQLEKAKAKTGKYPSSVLKTWKLNVEAVAEKSPASSELLQLSAFFAPDDIPYWMVIAGAKHLGKTLAELLGQEEYDLAVVTMAELLEPLSQYSLVRWDGENQRYGVHRLVQSVVRDEMDEAVRTGWVTFGVEGLNAAYPGSEFKYWVYCAGLLPHWLQVRNYAEQENVRTEALGLICNQAGFYLNAQGRYEAAEPLYLEALEMRKELLGDKHPDVALSLNNLAALTPIKAVMRQPNRSILKRIKPQ